MKIRSAVFLLLLVLACVPVAGAQQFGPWSTPVNLGPIVNSPANEQAVAISPDGLSLYFGSNRPGGYGGSIDIWVSHRDTVDAPWGPPENLGPNVNTEYTENGPVLSYDGHRLFFQSNRPGGFGGNDIYVSRRHNKRDDLGWRAAENLGSGVNTSLGENKAEFYEDEGSGSIYLYFRCNRPESHDIYDISSPNRGDICVSTLQPDETFGTAVFVDAFNSVWGEFSVTLRRDGLEAIVSSNRFDPPKFGGSDLWGFSRASTSDPWSGPVNLGPDVNTASEEIAAVLSKDGTELYFYSNRPGSIGGYDLYVSKRAKLGGPQ